MVLRIWIRLLAFLCIATVYVTGNVWFTRAKSFLFRSKTQEFLQGEKVRLESALHGARQVASSLQEENVELKKKVVGLKSSSQNLKKELVLLRLEHMKAASEAAAHHTKTTAELRESFKKFRSKEINTITKKLEGQFQNEKKDLLAMLEAKHADEVQTLQNSIRSADGAIHQHNQTIQELNKILTEKEQEIGIHVERERLSIADKDKLIEEIATLSQSLQHIKLAEEARVMDIEGTVVPEPVAEPMAQAQQPDPEPASLSSVPEGLAHSTGAAQQERGSPVIVETSSRRTSRKVGGARSRRSLHSHSNQHH